MHTLVTWIRNTANRYPRLGWFLADIIRRYPRLNETLALRYGIRIPPRPTSDERFVGYRFPLAANRDQLTERARRMLSNL